MEILGSKKARLLFSYENPVLCRSIYRQLKAVLVFLRHYRPGFLHRRDEGRILLYQNLPVLGGNVTPHRLRKTFFYLCESRRSIRARELSAPSPNVCHIRRCLFCTIFYSQSSLMSLLPCRLSACKYCLREDTCFSASEIKSVMKGLFNSWLRIFT